MNNHQPKKKRLNFEEHSFEFKAPCREVTNTIESNDRAPRTTSASFGDDEESSRESVASSCSAVSVANRDTVNVFLRLKPGRPIPDIYSFDSENVILKSTQPSVDRIYTFSSVLEQSTDQKTVYDNCVRPILTNPFSESGAVFASYGVSNSGKTYTILGEKSDGGIVPRALAQLFTEYENHIAVYPCVKVVNDQINILDDAQVECELTAAMDLLQESRNLSKVKGHNEQLKAEILKDHEFVPKTTTAHQQIFIWISFVEIYNEKINDLFKLQKQPTTILRPLKIINNNRNSYVHGLTWLHVETLEKALELLQAGVRKVNYAATGMNNHSSRSHTIFTINIISECDLNYEFSSYKFCDLAGAERVSKTGNMGERIKEAGGINTSLMVLGKCLEAVLNNQKATGKKKEIVPVRESKLTFLLQSSLMGREKFVMIVNLLPTIECYEENVNVLHFGSIANKIITRKTEVKRYSRLSTRYTYFMQNVNSPKMNSSTFDESGLPEAEDSSILSTSFMSTDELRRMLRLKDVEIITLRRAVEEAERRNIMLRQDILKEFQGCAEVARKNDKKYYEENEERLKSYHEKKMNSMRLASERRQKDLNDHIDYLQSEIKKLRKKFGVKDDEDIIDLDDTEDESESDFGDTSLADDEIENYAP